MAENILVVGPDSADTAQVAGDAAARFGDDIGYVNPRLAPEDVRKVGSRIEEDRDFGGHTVSAFDESLTVGSAVAQLAGFADAVIVDRLECWAVHLDAKWDASFDDRIVEEIAAVTTVMTADLTELVFVTSAEAPTGRAGEIHARILAAMDEHLTERLGG